MRDACRAAVAAIAVAVLTLPALAQNHANGLAVESTNPDADAAIILKMRAHMDKIHKEQHRPTVGLVLSGGGAKGAAHVGVLKYLKEQEIPVDAIFGTSIGGLVGGFAALGYSPEFMDSLFRNQDWSVMLTDRIDRSYYSLQQKLYKETYLLSVPFHYSDKDFQTRIDEQVRYGDPNEEREFGRNSLMTSLPSGYVYGFNVNNMLSSYSVGYQDNMSFDELPIPFFCVAADMVSVKAKNWSYGSLKTAMRSTMSIPGMFKPVRTEGMVLVDGGVRNNFPVDLAKSMGCDIIIGVSLSDKAPSYSQINNLLDIVSQFITMLGYESMSKNYNAPDVFIKPDLDGYNMLSFNSVAIDTMIHRGYESALVKSEELAEVKKLMKGAKPYLNAPKAVDISKTPVQIYAVEFKGLNNSESRYMHRVIKLEAGSYVDKEIMDDVMSKIEATGCFSTVTYSILGSSEPYRLVFDCVKGPLHQLGMGVRFDTEEWASFLFNIGFNAHKLNGIKFDIDAKLGRTQMARGKVSLDVDWLPTINFDAMVRNVSASIYPEVMGATEEASWSGHSERLYLSNLKWKTVDFNLGAQYRYYSLSSKSKYGYDIYKLNPDLTRGGFLGVFGNGTLYTMDRSFLPSKGVKLTFGADYDFMKYGGDEFSPIFTGYVNFNTVIPLGNGFALLPELHVRAMLENNFMPADYDADNPKFSLSHKNYVGGVIPNRYIDGQIPFIGFGNVYQAGPLVGVAQLGLRARLGNFYMTATGGYFQEYYEYGDIIDKENILESLIPAAWGAGLEFAYVMPIGPIKMLGTWSPRNNNFAQDSGFYVSIGFDF